MSSLFFCIGLFFTVALCFLGALILVKNSAVLGIPLFIFGVITGGVFLLTVFKIRRKENCESLRKTKELAQKIEDIINKVKAYRCDNER